MRFSRADYSFGKLESVGVRRRPSDSRSGFRWRSVADDPTVSPHSFAMMKKDLLAALVAATCSMGPGCAEPPAHDVALTGDTEDKAVIQTCQHWIASNLDLGDTTLEEYHVDVEKFESDGQPLRYHVQFAHRHEMADRITPHGIEAVHGGFPDYFTLTLSGRGTKVTDHYASVE